MIKSVFALSSGGSPCVLNTGKTEENAVGDAKTLAAA